MNRIVSALLVSLALTPLLTGIAHAQITYDAANHAYFVTSDATINTDITGNSNGGRDVFVGKDNFTDFHTLVGPITLTVADGANISRSGSYPKGQFYWGLNVFGTNVVSITGGIAAIVSGYDSSATYISGGTTTNVFGYDTSGINISGGRVFHAYGSSNSDINISGGTTSYGDNIDNSIANISGGMVTRVTGEGASATNISGGKIGGIDANLSNLVGIYELSGMLNLYGSGFVRTGITAGDYNSRAGSYSTLTGTLLDGTALSTTLFLADGVTYEGLGGGTQSNPILPDSNNDGVFTFNGPGGSGVPSGAWFDPPLVGAYDFAMLGEDFFTSILNFPSGIGDADGLFTVSVGGVALGQFSSGTAVNFADFGFAGGVSGFTVSGIDPTVDAGNPTAFPIKLAFSSPFASFTMTGITGAAAAPEPATLLLVLPILGFAALRRKRA